MSRIPRKKQEDQFRLYRELTFYDGAGVKLWLEGVKSTPEEIVKACCTGEGKSYMRDYIRNASEEVTDIAFDSIDEDL